MDPLSRNPKQKETQLEPSNKIDAMAVIDALALEVASLTKRAVIAEARVADLENKMKESK